MLAVEWRKNRIAIGALVFFVLLGLTAWAVNSRNRRPTTDGEIPTIELDRETITALEITRPGDGRVVLSKVDDAWRVIEPLDATADRNNVDSALNRLAELELSRVVATKPDHYARLQVDDENAVRVTVRAGDETLSELMVGKYGNGMTMVRIDERSEVFGASGSLRYAFDRELKAWRDRKVVSMKPEDVQSIRFEGPKGTFAFEREGEAWAAREGNKALGKFDPKQVSGKVSSTARLVASDFAAPDISEARAGLTEPRATVTLISTENPGPIVLELGAATEQSGELYLRRRGEPTVYVISQYLADRLQPDAAAFQPPPSKPPPASPAPPPVGGQQQPQLPPEVMEQLREQIRAQQEQQGRPQR
ncbi:MAG: DUF4340 domain-containing protein [Myxococcales bacterium]|nr:DUF4340 domain-containing protein [Myxococcales bacterium]